MDSAMHDNSGIHLIICGSPRRAGRSAQLAAELAADDMWARVIYVSELAIAGCCGCDACRGGAPEIQCVHRDDMETVYDQLIEAERLTVVSPLYFAGPPSQFKAFLDRLQPFYWAQTRKEPKRPARLYVIGEGGDPHGADPLITIVRSALAVAGFSLDMVELRIDGNNES